uniref:glycerol kinase n=1 Tax=Romanomermis culicivorax TaxID=13658 RepID=A0A915JI23_ROMCU
MTGTIDTWLIWNLTGGLDCGVYITDVTNASRTMLMNIRSLNWDTKLLTFFELDQSYLPEIRSSSEIYGHIKVNSIEQDSTEFSLNGVPISGCLGDQQAALVGEACFEEMSCKNTYGTGCFLLSNTGLRPVFSKHGLLTTVAYKFGPNQPPCYALEGSVAVAGQCLKWLRDNLDFFNDYDQCDEMIRSVQDDSEVYFVPAFSGLYAPYWHSQARGIIIGLTSFTRKGHILKAAFEAVCYQTRDILEAMCKDSGGAATPSKVKLLADGGMTKNDYFMQMQADLLGTTIRRDHLTESTSLGVAIAAGLAPGVQLWTMEQVLAMPTLSDDFKPKMNSYERDSKYQKWKDAVSRCQNWTRSGAQSSSPSIWSEIFEPLLLPTAALCTGALITVCIQRFFIRN